MANKYMVSYGKDCITRFFKLLLVKKYNGYTIYAHNLFKFYFVFLLKYFSDNCDMKIIGNEEGYNLKYVIVKYDLYNKKNNLLSSQGKITFMDSLLIFHSSLDKVVKSFNINKDKMAFPYMWFDSWDKINFIGKQPDMKYYGAIKPINIDMNSRFNARFSSIMYCKNDCYILAQCIFKYKDSLMSLYSLSLTNYPTLSSIAFAVYRSNFMESNIIAHLVGKPYIDIKKSYLGGIVDVYHPICGKAYYYDINSLYPYSMLKPMPIGNPTYIRNGNNIILSEFFGFINATVKCPDNLHIPLLSTKINNKLISPTGTFNGWFFSEELKLALKLGYEISINEGYLFEQDIIFNKYVTSLYEVKLSSINEPVKRKMAKDMLNSLYGRFGLKELDYDLIVCSELDVYNINILSKYQVQLVNKISDNKSIYSLRSIIKNIKKLPFSNVAIASAITSYSRIEIYKYKTIKNNICYYSDTDSVILQYPLPVNLVNNSLGSMKLEYVIQEGVFISTKVYGFKLFDGSEIVKIKGFSGKVSYNLLKELLIKNTSINLVHSKFIRDLSISSISINSNVIYTLKSVNGKRINVYNKNNICIGTIPYSYSNISKKLELNDESLFISIVDSNSDLVPYVGNSLVVFGKY